MPRPARLRGTALLLGLALTLAGLPGAAAAARPTGRVITLDHAIPGRYIVSLKAGRATTAAATRASARRLAAGHDVTVGATFTRGLGGFAPPDTTPAGGPRAGG